MKIGVANILSDYEVILPPEIIASIVSHVQNQPETRMRTLWACCLLSREWYNAAIGLLYTKPNLTNKNFDKFVRTICPPVNAHIRRIGLEELVHDLDMGRLAYESTNSLTARLIRRTRLSLEVFVAPAASFSISSLAPLSKCINLKVLDLSRDFYVILLGQLLRPICELPIRSLSLPRSALRRPYQLAPKYPNGAKWPKTLEHLGINDWLPSDAERWTELFASLPSNLTSIAFDECFNWQSFWYYAEVDVPAINIRTLRITVRRDDGGFPIDLLQKAFPAVTMMTISAPLTELEEIIEIHVHQDRKLQHLRFIRSPQHIHQTTVIPCSILSTLVDKFPALRRIDLPKGYLKLDDDEADLLDDIEIRLATRIDGEVSSGVYEI